MKTNCKLALAVLAGVPISLAAAQPLHTQHEKTPPAYVIAEIEKDSTKTEDPAAARKYAEETPKTLAPLEALRILDEVGSPATIASAGGRYFGLVIGGALPVTVAANWIATAWDQNAVFRWTSPIAATLEDVCLEWCSIHSGDLNAAGG
jgi:glutamate/tyrosine decarboxylase-like PLP-dependent enzyme